MGVEFRRAELDNGLTIIGEIDPGAHTSACGFFVRTGARDEDRREMGVSHFLEHMMFKGTPGRTAEQINRELDAIGSRSNAYTSSEMTVFYSAMLPEYLERGLEILSDMMRPALREEDFVTEKGVILEEIAMYRDDPGWVLYERAVEEHYAEHPLGYRVLGTEQTIGALRVEAMRDYFRRRYSADNTTLAVAGRVDWDRLVERAAAYCGHWERTSPGRVVTRPRFRPHSFVQHDAKVTRAYRLLLAEGPGAADPARYTAYILALLLGGPDNSRFHWSLIESGLAEEADASYEPKEGVGDLRLFVACEASRLQRVWDLAMDEARHLADRITPEDVERVRARIATGATLAGERPEGRMQRIGRQWLTLGEYTTLEEELERINRVSVRDVRDLCAAIDWSVSTTGTLLPDRAATSA